MTPAPSVATGAAPEHPDERIVTPVAIAAAVTLPPSASQPLSAQNVKPAAVVRPVSAPPPPATSAGDAKATADGIYVQMASLDSEQAAQAEWQLLRARWPDLFGDRAPAVERAEVHERTFWRLRTGGFASAADANSFCARLRAAGPGCWTVGYTARN